MMIGLIVISAWIAIIAIVVYGVAASLSYGEKNTVEILERAWRPVRALDFTFIPLASWRLRELERKRLLRSFTTPGGPVRGGRPIRWYELTEEGRIALELVKSNVNR